ncbi:MAG TPA: PilZ domain-containing protein [Candidatus Acidoferrum sp.]
MATPSNPMNRRRSERVMLQMKVTVIAEDKQRKPRQEEGLTLVVNAHGGLLKMKMDVHVGQPMRLVNPQNSVEQYCRVVRVEDNSLDFFSVAFEFDHANPKFWPVVFPPSDWQAPARDAAPGN